MNWTRKRVVLAQEPRGWLLAQQGDRRGSPGPVSVTGLSEPFLEMAQRLSFRAPRTPGCVRPCVIDLFLFQGAAATWSLHSWTQTAAQRGACAPLFAHCVGASAGRSSIPVREETGTGAGVAQGVYGPTARTLVLLLTAGVCFPSEQLETVCPPWLDRSSVRTAVW